MHAWDDGGYKVVVEKYLLPVAIRPFLCPCLRISPVQSAWYHYIPPLAFSPPGPGRPRLLSTRTARAAPHSSSFSSSARRKHSRQRFSSLRVAPAAPSHVRGGGRARARADKRGAGGGGRASRGARKAKVPTDVFFNY